MLHRAGFDVRGIEALAIGEGGSDFLTKIRADAPGFGCASRKREDAVRRSAVGIVVHCFVLQCVHLEGFTLAVLRARIFGLLGASFGWAW